MRKGSCNKSRPNYSLKEKQDQYHIAVSGTFFVHNSIILALKSDLVNGHRIAQRRFHLCQIDSRQ